MSEYIEIHRIHSKKDILIWIYVKIRYENFHRSVIVDNMKEDCVLLEKLRKLQRVFQVLRVLCALGFKVLSSFTLVNRDERFPRIISQGTIPGV